MYAVVVVVVVVVCVCVCVGGGGGGMDVPISAWYVEKRTRHPVWVASHFN